MFPQLVYILACKNEGNSKMAKWLEVRIMNGEKLSPLDEDSDPLKTELDHACPEHSAILQPRSLIIVVINVLYEARRSMRA